MQCLLIEKSIEFEDSLPLSSLNSHSHLALSALIHPISFSDISTLGKFWYLLYQNHESSKSIEILILAPGRSDLFLWIHCPGWPRYSAPF